MKNQIFHGHVFQQYFKGSLVSILRWGGNFPKNRQKWINHISQQKYEAIKITISSITTLQEVVSASPKSSTFIQIFLLPLVLYGNGLFQKKNQTGGLRIYFFVTTPGIFRFFTLPLEIQDKTRLHPYKLHKIVLHLSEILRSKTKTIGNSRWFLLHEITPRNSMLF